MNTLNTFKSSKYGLLISEKNNYQVKTITFKKIVKLFEDLELHRPLYQTALDEDKVDQMVEAYLENPDYLVFKNIITIAIISNKLFVVDGQHRLEMSKKIFEDNDINDYLTMCYFKIDTDDEMKKLFKEINKDSYKNHKYVSLSEFESSKYDLCKEYLTLNYKQYFAPNKTKYAKLFTISEFLDKLVEIKYFDKFNNFDDIKTDIINKNSMFAKKVGYKDLFLENKPSFYKYELKCVEHDIAFPLIRNNFIEYLIGLDNITPTHQFIKQQTTISKKLRNTIWKNEFGDATEGTCPFYNCNITINNGPFGFECGHIISDYNGGDNDASNLRPICRLCNGQMSRTNWIDYEKQIKKENRLKKKQAKTDIVI